MRRTKENLIAQHQARREKEGLPVKKVSFSFSQFPSGKSLQLGLLFVVLAVVLFALPVVLPDFGKSVFFKRAIDSVSNFELDNEVFQGQFSESPRVGDTRGNREATFQAVSILTQNGGQFKNVEMTQTYVNQLESKDFNKNTKEIYQGIVQLKSLDLLKEGSVSQKYAKKYYDLLLQLVEQHSGFRLNNLRSASVGATFYALKALEELNKLGDFQQASTEQFTSVVNFVVSMKDVHNGGFRDSAGENATILATYHAIQVLALVPRTESVAKAFEGIESFIYSCQRKDGGFANEPAESIESIFYTNSKAATTIQAIHVLEFLRSQGLISLAVLDPSYPQYYDANSYLRACLSLKHGIMAVYPSNEPDLEATYYFTQLVKEFTINYGTPRSIQLSFVGVGILFLFAALFNFYNQQISSSHVKDARHEFKWTLFLLAAGAVATHVFPPAAIIVYFLFAMRLAILFYEIASTDNTDGILFLVAVVNSFLFLGLVFTFNLITPLVFANARVFYMLVAWGLVVTFVVTVGACYLSAIKKVSFYVNAAVLAWVANVIVFNAYAYGRGDTAFVYRLLDIHGHFPLVLVVLPVVYLALTYASSALAAVMYLRGPSKKSKSK